MGNVVGSFFSGLGRAIDKLLGHPLEFLSGKSCNSVCAPTWDFICYIENFCVAQLLKFVMVAMLVYFVLLFLYLLYNLGICQCICRTLFRITWACFSTCFSSFDFCCSYLCYKLRTIRRLRKRRRRKKDIEEFDGQTSPYISSEDDEYELEDKSIDSYFDHRGSRFSRRRNYKVEHLRKSLRPTNHRARVELSGHLHGKRALKNSIEFRHNLLHDHIRVNRSSKFSQKGSKGKNGILRHRRR
ncbi:hypothetical protein STAS_26387 [Striga asiatica]|uniref:Uncharacterized protein n=2 Tax=Striga asiatica TaxID=4170 RepID=A0A5A7QVR5_STRAF|nr:hypothetical protein STAS_26387 [Striga asiatica]